MDRDSFEGETDYEAEIALSRNARALRNYGPNDEYPTWLDGWIRASPLERRYNRPNIPMIENINLWNESRWQTDGPYSDLGGVADNLNGLERGWWMGTDAAEADRRALQAMAREMERQEALERREMERQEALERPTRFVQDRWRYLRQRPYMPIRPLTAADRAALRDTKAPPIVPTATPRNRPYDRLLARHRGGLAGQRAVVRARPARRRKK